MADELLSEFSGLNTPSFGDLESARQPTGYGRLGATIGANIFGRGARDAAAFNTGAVQGVRMQSLLSDARKKRDEELGRQAAAQKAFNGGDSDLGNAILQGHGTPEEVAGYLKTKQGINFASQAWNEATRTDQPPNLELLNRMGLVREGKGFDLTKVSDGVAFNPNVLPSSQTISPTAIGQSEIGMHNASAARDNAMAAFHAGPESDAARALADARRAKVPGTDPAMVQTAFDVPPQQNLTGDAYLGTLDPQRRNVVQAVIDGRYPVPTGRAATSPEWMAVVRDATQADPTFDAGNYPARAAARKDLTGAGPGVKQIQSLNTLAGHINDLVETSGKLKNKSAPIYNAITNFALTNLGDPRSPNFERAADTVAGEFAYLLKGGVPSVSEIQEQRRLLTPNMSPEQLKDQVRIIASQVESRLNAVQERANQGLGLGARDVQVIAPQSRALFDRLSSGGGAGSKTAMPPNGTKKTVGGQTFTVVNGHWDDGR
jgi:hypothetical protein